MDRVQVHAHLETGTQQLVQVGAKRLLLVAGVRRDPAVFLDEARQEIRRLIIAAGDARVGLDRERVLAVQGFLVVEERARAARQVADAPDKRPRCGVARDLWSPHAERIGRIAVDARPHPVCEGKRAEALRDAEARRARPPTPRVDDDHAVRCLGAVDCGRRRALQHLDALDIVWVEIGDAVDGVVLVRGVAPCSRGCDGIHVARDGIIRDHYPVYHDEWIDARVNGRHAAQVDLAAAARRARVHLHQGARDLSLEGAFERRRRGAVQLLGVHRRHSVREVPLLDGGRLARDYHGLEIEHILLEADLDADLVGRDRYVPVPESDTANLERHRSGGSRQGELAPVVRHGGDRRAPHGPWTRSPPPTACPAR